MTRISRTPDGPEGADLLQAAREVAENGEQRVIRFEGRPIAVLVPYATGRRGGPGNSSAPHRPKPIRRRGERALTSDDSFWNIVGIAAGAGPTNVAAHKDEYLAEADASETE